MVMGLHQLKVATRSKVHAAFSYPANYVSSVGADPVPCTVRLLVPNGIDDSGDLDSEGFVQRAEQNVIVRFLLSEVEPIYGATVTLNDTGEVFTVTRVLPAYNITQDCEVRRGD